jgi:hypothetical protein
LSVSALLLLLFIGVIGAWKVSKLKTLEAGWKQPSPLTACAGEDWLVTGLGASVPLFFRMHFRVKGRFFPDGGSRSCPVFAQTSASRGEDSARLELDFPMSGLFQGEGFCRLRDIFGFYSFACGIDQKRTVKVRSEPCFAKKLPVNAQSGAEDRRNRTSTDEERYYMREYTPGDRFRDINWKSSEKIDSLITRISPDNQEKVSIIEVYFRNYGPCEKPSLDSLWLLDRAKARLSHFLRSLKEESDNISASSYVFSVRAAQGSWEIENNEDLESFLDELAGFSFASPQNEGAAPAGKGDLYVFSTACDTGLNGFLIACNPRPVSLFLTQPFIPLPLGEKDKEPKRETFYKRDFLAKGCVLLPRWLSGDKIKHLGANAGRVEMNYAEIKL